MTFAVVYSSFGQQQMISNFAAFCMAVTFSFFANAKWTYQVEHTTAKYFLYVGFMGLLALGCGYLADRVELSPILTLLCFSLISLFVGFIYSTYIVFRAE
ncbi:GtrA family protein [Dickeya undicola]|uniref:GtrA family protein n=1 Tax=Dickeya undicola TaxID=1577887 RepID=UPI0029620406|nr:GtrA family protein [Dickeya undicola]